MYEFPFHVNLSDSHLMELIFLVGLFDAHFCRADEWRTGMDTCFTTA